VSTYERRRLESFRNHRDPFDRLIVAMGLVESLTIVSSDSQFRLYSVPLVDARH
jgi:PIN domain nuclease of toxin-antitoxin system